MSNKTALDWMIETRGLDPSVWTELGVRTETSKHGAPIIDLPYHQNGEIVGRKIRNVAEKAWWSVGKARPLYNVDSLNDAAGKTIVITEGEFDCLAVIQAGFRHAVSLPDGWTARGNKTDALQRAADKLAKASRVVVAGDNDETGESLPKAVWNLLDGVPVYFVTWPEGCKDANDTLVKFGVGKITEAIEQAKRVFPDGGIITGFSDLPPLSQRRVLKTGNAHVDYRVGFELGSMSVITGKPGAGKSAFVTWMGDEIALYENVRVGFFSFETHAHRVRDQLCTKRLGREFFNLRTDEKRELLRALDKSWAMVHRTFGKNIAHGIDFLTDMVRELAVIEQCKLIFVDPWNELEHFLAQGESLTNYINYALTHIRQLADKYDVHICIVAHPKKMQADSDRLPEGYDIADSAAFANKPALGLSIGRFTDNWGADKVKLLTWKVRDTKHQRAYNGTTELTFDVNSGVYCVSEAAL